MKPLWLTIAAVAFVALLVAQTSGGNGKAIFDKRCGGCHALDRDKEGPRLGNVFGRRAGTIASFEYSSALKESKITWNTETLDKWLTNTESLVPNNEMTFRVQNPEERRAIIEYLRTLPSTNTP
jgi:cytochrome c